jgi:hypothetical protein
MLQDALSRFSGSFVGGVNTPQTVTGTNTTVVSTFAYDLLAGGQVPTTPGTYSTPPVIIGNAPLFGMDFGIGSISAQPRVVGEAIAAFTGGTSLTVQFVGQADPGTGTLGAWTVYESTGALVPTLLTANTRIFVFDWPSRQSFISRTLGPMPRFVALQYVIVGAMTTGSIYADNTIGGSDDAQGNLNQYAANFVVAA